jgi:FecR protein
MEGDVAVVRNGAAVDNVAIGLDVENFDLVKTGSDGLAELDLGSPQSPRMTVKVSSDTQFSLEIASLPGSQQTTVNIVGGSISMKVARLSAAQAVQVKTDTTAMGVRGTDFVVTAPPSGDVLVTCDDGEVVCTDDQGRELHAIPGTVVEKRPAELFRAVPVSTADLEGFRSRWSAERLQNLEQNAFTRIQANVTLYNRLVQELNQAYAELTRSQRIVNKWKDEDRRGRIGQRNEVAQERRVVGALLVRLRRTQFQLERVIFRLERLKRVHDRGFGAGTLSGGVTTAQFFQRLDSERPDVEQKLAQTRYVTKMYGKRNEGRVP